MLEGDLKWIVDGRDEMGRVVVGSVVEKEKISKV